ncbi:unnamed protein product [Brassicogethes aeneus]|uniref:Uncharacterized protein n=1 Tax=Brassicogethes aeneus TaxID=1431903 RepID=A0A9P0FPF1_BRAAE|nr:unnamed protein product [Brassicogethes aeneus]
MWPLFKLNIESSQDFSNKKMIYQCRGLPFVRTERLPKYMYLIVPEHRDDGRGDIPETAQLSLNGQSKMQFLTALFCIVFAILLVQGPVLACIKNRDGCQPDGSQGNCCSGFCYKESGWVAGYCK